MSIEHTAPEPIQEMLQPLSEGTFRFSCHPQVPCFTECCRDLKLMLTPYDVLRLKGHLGLSAGDFLDRYAEVKPDEQRNLPTVTLSMMDNERRTCPFVSPKGCAVYGDRPSACRIYPIARASRRHPLHGSIQESYFVLRENHCKGFDVGQDWSTDEWLSDQGLEAYHDFNDLWMAIITHSRLAQGASLTAKQQQMFFMASYNLDRFREFVLGSRFLQLFELPEEDPEMLARSDEALLRLAFRWLSFSLLNEPSLKPRQ